MLSQARLATMSYLVVDTGRRERGGEWVEIRVLGRRRMMATAIETKQEAEMDTRKR